MSNLKRTRHYLSEEEKEKVNKLLDELVESLPPHLGYWLSIRFANSGCAQMPKNHNAAIRALGESLANYDELLSWDIRTLILACLSSVRRRDPKMILEVPFLNALMHLCYSSFDTQFGFALSAQVLSKSGKQMFTGTFPADKDAYMHHMIHLAQVGLENNIVDRNDLFEALSIANDNAKKKTESNDG